MYRYALLSLVFVILRSNGHQRGSQGLLGDDLAVYYLGRDPVAEAQVEHRRAVRISAHLHRLRGLAVVFQETLVPVAAERLIAA